MPDWVQGTTMTIETYKINWDWILTRKHYSSSHCDSHRDCSRSQHWDRCSHHRSSSQSSHSIHRGHRHRPHHNTPHWSHQKSSTHRSSSCYWSQDYSRSSQPSYTSSRHESHWSDSYSSSTRRTPHPKKNMKVKIGYPYSDYYSSIDHSSDSGEDSDPLN